MLFCEHLQGGKLNVPLLGYNYLCGREIVIHYPHRNFVAPRMKGFTAFVPEMFKAEKSLHVNAEASRNYAA